MFGSAISKTFLVLICLVGPLFERQTLAQKDYEYSGELLMQVFSTLSNSYQIEIHYHMPDNLTW